LLDCRRTATAILFFVGIQVRNFSFSFISNYVCHLSVIAFFFSDVCIGKSLHRPMSFSVLFILCVYCRKFQSPCQCFTSILIL
jgi:hypothetical protein